MPENTTIQVSTETKQLIENRKVGDESFDQALQRILGDGEKLLWDEAEIRELARTEAETVVEGVSRR